MGESHENDDVQPLLLPLFPAVAVAAATGAALLRRTSRMLGRMGPTGAGGANGIVFAAAFIVQESFDGGQRTGGRYFL